MRRGKCTAQASETCVCSITDRVDAYRHVALLLRGPEQGVRNSVLRLAAAVDGCQHVPYVDEAELRRVAGAAAESLLTEEGRKAFADQRAALFGETRYDPFINSVPSLESTYLGGSDTVVADRVRRLYTTTGYRPPRWLARVEGPDHMAVELDFMAYCLVHSTGCGPHYVDVAECFYSEHLALWAVLFAAVTTRAAMHPALKFVGLALDKFIACEALTFRRSVSDLCSLHTYAATFAETL